MQCAVPIKEIPKTANEFKIKINENTVEKEKNVRLTKVVKVKANRVTWIYWKIAVAALAVRLVIPFLFFLLLFRCRAVLLIALRHSRHYFIGKQNGIGENKKKIDPGKMRCKKIIPPHTKHRACTRENFSFRLLLLLLLHRFGCSFFFFYFVFFCILLFHCTNKFEIQNYRARVLQIKYMNEMENHGMKKARNKNPSDEF